MTPQEKRIHAAKLEAEALQLRAEAEQESKQQQPVGPPIKSEAAKPRPEKKKWLAHEIASTATEADIEALLGEDKSGKKQHKRPR